MLTLIKSQARRFRRDEAGNYSLEAIIFLPLILSVLAATFSFHDAFRYKALNTKAAYTISDALSRETDPIDGAYLDGMVEVLEFLTRSEGPYSVRVTMVRYDADDDAYEVAWSKTRGAFDAMTGAEISDFRNQLPNLLHNERVIVVETATDYEPPFSIPVLHSDELFYNFAFTRPRFAPQLVWDDATETGA